MRIFRFGKHLTELGGQLLQLGGVPVLELGKTFSGLYDGVHPGLVDATEWIVLLTFKYSSEKSIRSDLVCSHQEFSFFVVNLSSAHDLLGMVLVLDHREVSHLGIHDNKVQRRH